ncbi:RbsK Sugar kinases, ribokinase family [uncultured Caudovirales phage]|uniref:RbsK Sugar kinases, ribokinase family n=1 Tax=uncultured Caudovirales phage TaxID=2100421 RepID=A0A6J5KTP3_9CAUD|nr:RbsK Sugar kinases, ribokinase family [uncultured Caudovirales phage]
MKKVALIGDLIKDIFIYGSCGRLNPEGPFPLITQESILLKDGGAGNVYENLKSLGVETRFFHLDRSLIPKKTRIVVGNSIIFRLDDEQIPDNRLFIESLSHVDFQEYDYVLLSDYNKGTLFGVEKIIEMAKSCKIIIDPKQDFTKYRGAWCIKPNRKEFEDFYGPCTSENIKKFSIENDHQVVIITLGKDGVMYFDGTEVKYLKAISDDVADVTGAGDCFLAALTYGLVNGYSLDAAINLGNLGAGVSVKHLGTYTLKKQDLVKTRVFTNGCFDILHRGHIDLLEKAKAFGDYLIVGLNSDASVRRLKGDSRPINSQVDRKKALESIKFVDEVVIFDETTPYNLIKEIKPDIITKGGDYSVNTVVGNDLAVVKIIPLTEGYSTTKILEKI